jgi:hypothetical protein
VLASLALWEGMPNRRSGRNLLRKPNRPPILRSPGTSGTPGALSARTPGVPAVRVDPPCCGEPTTHLIERCLSTITLLGQEPDISRVLGAYLPKYVAMASLAEVRSGGRAASRLGFPAGNCHGRRTTKGIVSKRLESFSPPRFAQSPICSKHRGSRESRKAGCRFSARMLGLSWSVQAGLCASNQSVTRGLGAACSVRMEINWHLFFREYRIGLAGRERPHEDVMSQIATSELGDGVPKGNWRTGPFFAGL